MYKYFLALSTLVILVGCASTGEMDNPPAYSVIKSGDTFQLNEKLTIPPNLARVYMQYGEVLPRKLVDQYYPNCNLLSFVVTDNEQIIHPDKFEVLRVSRYTELVQAKTIMLASNAPIRGNVLLGNHGPMAGIYITTLLIKSDKNPDIKKLECEAWREPHFGKHLSVADFRQTLGKIIELSLPATIQ